VCFVDFHKAFDTVIHPGIRYKLIRNGINGLFYRIICNMYSSSMVLIPNIFKLFLNDFSDIIENSNDSVYLQDKKYSCLLYADDSILISDSEQGLQDRLNISNKLRLLLLILYADNVSQFSHPYSKIGHIVWSKRCSTVLTFGLREFTSLYSL
jgi:hypothetical protein